MSNSLPTAVVHLMDAVSEKLGRPSSCRKVQNKEQWYIYDPVFSFIQRGAQKRVSGYRVGYFVDISKREIWFELLHSPVMAQLFKHNLVFSSFIEVIHATADFRLNHFVYRSSKQAIRLRADGESIQADSVTEFINRLNEFDKTCGFIKDMFPKRINTGKGGGNAPHAGNTFYLLLANKAKKFSSKLEIKQIVDYSWALFLCLYPVKPLEKRSAALARNLKAEGILKKCEFTSIQNLEGFEISSLCRGEIHGAHIKPHAFGGSDRPENGIWLCEFHHRITEGNIRGKRIGNVIDICFFKV